MNNIKNSKQDLKNLINMALISHLQHCLTTVRQELKPLLKVKLGIITILTQIGMMIATNSCSTNQKSIETVVFEYNEQCKNKKHCIIDFADVMPFKWDMMYVLPESVTNEGVNEIIGLNYSKNKDIARLILFIKE